MKQSVRSAIYQAILDNHWLDIRYKNKKDEESHFFIGINDIDIEEDKLYCEIFNCFKINLAFLLDEPMANLYPIFFSSFKEFNVLISTSLGLILWR